MSTLLNVPPLMWDCHDIEPSTPYLEAWTVDIFIICGTSECSSHTTIELVNFIQFLLLLHYNNSKLSLLLFRSLCNHQTSHQKNQTSKSIIRNAKTMQIQQEYTRNTKISKSIQRGCLRTFEPFKATFQPSKP